MNPGLRLNLFLSSNSENYMRFGIQNSSIYKELYKYRLLCLDWIAIAFAFPAYLFLFYQFSCSVMSDSLQPHGPQHTRPPCPSPTPKFTQTHVHRVGDTIQPSHPLSSPSPPAFNLSQSQGLFQWLSSSHQVAKVLELQLQHHLPMNNQVEGTVYFRNSF